MGRIFLDKEHLHILEIFAGNKETALYRAFEPEPGLFVAESKNVIQIALNKGYTPYCVVTTEKMLEDPLLENFIDVPVYVVNRKEAEEVLGYSLAFEIFAAFYRQKSDVLSEILTQSKRVVVLENVENPANLGAIFRTAAALGIEGTLLTKDCVDPLYRRSIRTATGNTLKVKWAFLEKGMDQLKEASFTTVALALREDNITISDPLLKKQDRLALILGNEGKGLKEETIQNADYVAKIPMSNEVDSLNVAVAAGLAMWEVLK